MTLTASSKGSMLRLVFVTFCVTDNRPNQCNSYAKLSLDLTKLVWSWMLQRGPRGSCNQSLYILQHIIFCRKSKQVYLNVYRKYTIYIYWCDEQMWPILAQAGAVIFHCCQYILNGSGQRLEKLFIGAHKKRKRKTTSTNLRRPWLSALV